MVDDSYIFKRLSWLLKITEVQVNNATKADLKSHFNRIHSVKAKQVDQSLQVQRWDWRSQQEPIPPVSKKRRQMSITETFIIMAQGKAVLQYIFGKTIGRFVWTTCCRCRLRTVWPSGTWSKPSILTMRYTGEDDTQNLWGHERERHQVRNKKNGFKYSHYCSIIKYRGYILFNQYCFTIIAFRNNSNTQWCEVINCMLTFQQNGWSQLGGHSSRLLVS